MRTLHTLVAGALAVGVVACQSFPWSGSATDSTGSAHIQRIIESGELRVGLTGDQPPLNVRNKRGDIVGLEIDIIGALAESMGLAVRLVPRPFAELLPALERGDVDLVISGMTITPERNARVAFAGPYFISGKSLLTKDPAIANVRNMAVLDDESRTYAALAGSTSADFVAKRLPKAKLVTTVDYESAVQMVIGDQVDALVADFQICQVTVMRNRDAGLVALRQPFTVEPLGIALPANAPLLVNLVQNYLATLEYTGLLTRFKAKWLSDDAWLAELP